MREEKRRDERKSWASCRIMRMLSASKQEPAAPKCTATCAVNNDRISMCETEWYKDCPIGKSSLSLDVGGLHLFAADVQHGLVPQAWRTLECRSFHSKATHVCTLVLLGILSLL